MTELLYQLDSYLREFTATVTAVDDEQAAITLDQTAFYPGGGGQPSDAGRLSAGEVTWQVKRAKKKGPDVWHFVEGDLPAVGTTVTGALDWERRYQLMRTHTALHVLCGVVWRD